MSSDIKLITPQEYIDDATRKIQTAQTRVCLLSLVFADQSKTHILVDALLSASRRGVAVEIAVDIFTYGEISGFLSLSRKRAQETRKLRQTAKKLVSSGVKSHWLGKSHLSIFNGRTHSKWCVVDDTVYSFGGVNIQNQGIINNDYMFKVSDGNLANILFREFHELVKADMSDRPQANKAIKWRDDLILIDGGLVNSSIIYNHACKLAARAQKIVLVSQYCPTGKLNKLLHQTDSQLYFNDYTQATTWLNYITIRSGMMVTKNQTLYQHNRYLHAKFMIFTMPGDEKVALSGSHNFVKAGVMLGTREIALETRDPRFIQPLEQFLRNSII